MDISVERERQQQRSTDRLRELAMKNRGVREDVERNRVLDPRDRALDRGIIPDRGMLERERLSERPVVMERNGIGEREASKAVPLGRIPDRVGRVIERDVHREVSPGLGRGGSLDRVRGLGKREREEERIPEMVRDDDAIERMVDRDIEVEESTRELVSSYKSALAELTFNSKPIITNLTIIAGENTHAAKGISTTVFNHIMEVPKEQKLPSLYLLDSIVKNIGGDYIKYFAARLPEVFCYAYRQVDPSTNPAMQHLFRTWRGVFPQGPLRLIESELNISSSAPNAPSGVTPPVRPAENTLPQPSHESPMPRPGHGIHVNPKYLEAQRQRLQQSGQAEGVTPESNGAAAARVTEGPNLRENSKGWADTQPKRPAMASRAKRDDYTDRGFGEDVSYDAEYDNYGSSNGPNKARRPVPGRITDREDGWESGYFRDGDGDGFGHEEGRDPTGRYGSRNGYEWRQPPRSTDVDGYGYNRGPGRGGPFRPGQAPIDNMPGRGRGVRESWAKAEEEEYDWEDMSPRLRPPPAARADLRTSDRLAKDDWYPNESVRNIPVGESGRLKRTSQDAGFSDNSSWRRNGPGVSMEQAHLGGDRRALKEYDERNMAGGGRESGMGPLDQVPGPARGQVSGPRPNGGWPSQASSLRNLSPPARTRPGPLMLSDPSNNISPTARANQNLLPRAGTPPTPNNGMGPPHNSVHFESRQSSRPNIGNFGGGSPTYNNLSPVTPAAGMAFQQRQQSHRRPPSPTQHSHQSAHQQIVPLASTQTQIQQLHHQLQHEQSGHLQGRHLMHMPGQLQSSQPLPQGPSGKVLQQVSPSHGVAPLLQSGQQSLQHSLQHLSSQQGALPPGSQVPATLQQLPVLHQGQQGSGQQPLSQLHQSQTQLQQPAPQLTAPLLPLISSQLAQSLQQLAQQQKSQSQQSQASSAQHQQQSSQSVNTLVQGLAPIGPGPSAGSGQSSENQTSNNNLLAAFLQSGLIPSAHSAPILPQSQPMTSLQPAPNQSAFQGQPPLPSGPPPVQFANTIGAPATVQVGVPGQMSSIGGTVINQMNTFGGQPQRYTQPPLPPGPPPASRTVAPGPTTSSAPSGVGLSNSISSLLSSLVAHGVIGAPGHNTSSVAPANPSVPVIGAQLNPNATFVPLGPLPTTSMSISSMTIPSTQAVTVAVSSSTTIVTQVAPGSPRKPKKGAIGVEFKQELLRERHEYVLEALYSDFPRQCKTCGLRFKAQDEHSKHMDWHVSRNRRQKSQKKVSRKWFVNAKEWLSGTSAAASESAPSFFAEDPGVKEESTEVLAVPADENQSACALCGELFENFFSDETEEWMYKGAVYLNVPQGTNTEGLDSSALGPIVHMKCKTESAETAAVDSIDDDDEVQPELQAADSVRMEVDGTGEDNIMPLLADNFDMSEMKEEEEEDLGNRRKRTRY